MRFQVAILAVLLSGCLSHNVQQYGAIDPTDHTIAVPPGAAGLKGELKKILTDAGWRLTVMDFGTTVTEGQTGAQTRLQSSDTFKTRYRLMVNAENDADACGWSEFTVRYEISMIDNKTGAEVFAMDGKECPGTVKKRFRDALNGKK